MKHVNYNIKQNCENQIIIKKSKFLSFSYAVNNVLEVESILKEKTDNFFDATHICYAYILNSGEKKCVDNGEPSGTAGKPILDVLEKKNLVDVVIVVVRYFGGIKLGSGGLLRAYSQSASEVVKKSEVCEFVETKSVNIFLNIDETKYLEKIKKNDKINNIIIDYGNKISVEFTFVKENELEIKDFLENLLSRTVEF